MSWNVLNDRYDAGLAEATLDKCIIELQHYLRHIRLHKDHPTACKYHTAIFKLEADVRRIYQETKNGVD